MNFKIVVSDTETRESYQVEVEQNKSGLLGKKIGDKISGGQIDLPEYELQITGGSDQQGFPMRREVEGAVRKKILLSHPPGFHPERKGQRKRKSIRGNTISAQIVQVNTKIIKKGPKSVKDLLGIKEKPKEAKPEKPAEKEAKPAETKPAEKPEKTETKPEKIETEKKKEPEEKMGIKKLEEVEKTETDEPKEKENKDKKDEKEELKPQEEKEAKEKPKPEAEEKKEPEKTEEKENQKKKETETK